MHWLIEISQAWWPLYAVHFVELALFVAVVWLLDVAFKLPGALRYTMWSLALLKAFIPPLIPAGLSTPALSPIAKAFLLQPVVSAAAAQPQSWGWPATTWLFVAWAFSAAAMVLVFIVQNRHLRRRLRNAVPAPELMTELELTHLIGGKQPPQVWFVERALSPLILGLIRPRIYLPMSLRRRPREEQRALIAHELAHLRYRDMWMLLLQLLALSLFALHPMIWLLHRRLLHLRELRCDEWALRQTNMAPKRYLEILMEFLQRTQFPYAAAAGAHFAENRKTLLFRFQNLLHAPAEAAMPSGGRIAILLALVALFVGLSLRYERNSTFFLSPQRAFAEIDPLSPAHLFDEPPLPANGLQALMEKLPPAPPHLLSTKQEWKMAFDLLIDKDGRVREVTPVESSDARSKLPNMARYIQYVAAILRNERFTPARRDGQPIAAAFRFYLTITPQEPKSRAAKQPLRRFEKPEEIFVAYDQPPMPIGGFQAIQRNLKYPAIARRAGIEGRVIVNVLIDVDGSVVDAQVLRSLGKSGCDEAAIKAVKSVRWTPAKKKNIPQKVWVAVPVIFKLKK